MSTLARRRHIPAPSAPMAELEVDLARLRRIYEQLPEMRHEGEDLIRAARAAGITVKEITGLTKLTPQRIYQVIGNDRGGRTENGSNGADE